MLDIKLKLDVSFSADEGSDIFVFVKSDFNDNEVDFIGLTFEQILENSEALLSEVETEDGEKIISMKQKIEASMNKFLNKMDLIVAEKAVDLIFQKIDKTDLHPTDKIRAIDGIKRVLSETTLHDLREFTPVYKFGHKLWYSDFSSLFRFDQTTFEPEWFWRKIEKAIQEIKPSGKPVKLAKDFRK